MKIVKVVHNPYLGELVVAKFTSEVAKFVDDNRLDWIVFKHIVSFESAIVFDNWKEPLKTFMGFDYVAFPLPAKEILLDLTIGKD